MHISHSRFELGPKVQLNRFSQKKALAGVYLRSEEAYAEYFPHESLGDESVETFLKTFPNPENPFHAKILENLKRPLPETPSLSFFNHQLWRPGQLVISPVVKYKLLHELDFDFFEVLEQNHRVRLDANGLFTVESFERFREKLKEVDLSLIDYIEDPLSSRDWSSIGLVAAQDFVQGEPSSVKIYKPDRSVFPTTQSPVIFSGNMGTALSSLSAYDELIKHGNLKEFHGILTPGLYQDEDQLFFGNYAEGFAPDLQKVKAFYQTLHTRNWTSLCTI